MARDHVTGETRIVVVKGRGHIRIEETGAEYSGGGHDTRVIRDGDALSAGAGAHDGDKRIWSRSREDTIPRDGV